MSNYKEKLKPEVEGIQEKLEKTTTQTALDLIEAGYSLTYSDPDGKHPPGFGEFEIEPPENDLVEIWFDNQPGRNIELLGGYNGTYALDFDNKDGRHWDKHQKFCDLVIEKLGKDLGVRLLKSLFHHKTKTGGSYRVVWRCEKRPQILVDSRKTSVAYDLEPNGKRKAFIELLTRFIVPGGNPAYQPIQFNVLGYPWDGTPLTDLDDLEPEYQQVLIDVAQSLNIAPAPPEVTPAVRIEGDSVGNRFDAYCKANPDTWEMFLIEAGWKVCPNGHKRKGTLFNRPDAKTDGVDGSVKFDTNTFYVFSSSVSQLESDKAYQAHTIFVHFLFDGNYTEAIRALAKGWHGLPPFGDDLKQELAVIDELDTFEYEDSEPGSPGAKPDGEKKQKAATTLLLQLIRSECSLFRSIDQEDWVTLHIDGHYENLKLFSKKFESYLYGRCLAVHGKFPNDADIKKVLKASSFECRNGAEIKVYTRVARVDDRIYLDLGTPDWSAIEISPSGWRVIKEVPIKFRRGKNVGPLPQPVSGGSIDPLKPISGCAEEDWMLIVGLILDAFKGRGPYLTGVVTGQQGSAKSWLCELIRTVVDPLKYAPLCSLPTDEKSLAISATQDYMLAFDNVSHLPSWLSDSLCRLATGGGLRSRELYTDSEQCVLSVCNPVLLNGIPDFAEAADLLSRSVIIHQPVIDEKSRLQKDDLLATFEAVKPKVFGAILDLLVTGLRDCKKIKFEEMPRMADSAAWVTACLGNNDFLDCYFGNQEDAIESSLDSSPIAPALKEYFSNPGAAEILESSDLLLVRLRKWVLSPGENFPKTPRALVNRLKRDAPALRSIGIMFELDRTKKGRKLRLYNTFFGVSSSGDASG